MNYAAHYSRLMERAESRVLTGYFEKHHVVPRCLDKTSKHTVCVTPEEHYVAHQLLVKMHPRHYGLTHALAMLTGTNKNKKSSNKLYGWIRRELMLVQTGRKHTPEAIANMCAVQKGHPVSEEQRAKLSAAKLGKPGWKHTEESRAKMSVGIKAAFANGATRVDQTTPEYQAAHPPRKGWRHTPEVCAKIAASNSTRVVSEETREKMRVKLTGRVGKPHTDEERARISATNKATWVLRHAKMAGARAHA
jgi:hypothetical protein